MKCLLALVSLSLHAGVADVSTSTSAPVRHGDTLSFEIFTWNYMVNARAFGLPISATDLSFALVTAPGSSGQFAATLTPSDASIGVTLGFASGYLSSAGLQGTVSTLQGQFHAASGFPQDLLLSLENTGSDVVLGLDPFTLQQDLFVSLSGGPLSAGGVVGQVQLRSVEGFQSLFLFSNETVPADGVPEPDSWWLIAIGGALLCGFAGLRKRAGRGRS